MLGVCGGYQMLGTALDDPDGVEQGGRMDGMGPVSYTHLARPILTMSPSRRLISAGLPAPSMTMMSYWDARRS